MKEKWTSQNMKQRHGDSTVLSIPSSNITIFRMDTGHDTYVKNLSLKEYIENMWHNTSDRDVKYQFDKAHKIKGNQEP